jgi:hypothetical protein
MTDTIVTVSHALSSVWVALACLAALVLGVMNLLAIGVMCFHHRVTYILLTIGVGGLLVTMLAARIASNMPLPTPL